MIILPAHSSHILQPLDISVFGPFKKYLKEKIANEQRLQRKGKYENFHIFVQKPFELAATSSNITAGFWKCGIYPFDSEKVLTSNSIKKDDLYDPLEKFNNHSTWTALEYISVMNKYGLDSHVLIEDLETKQLQSKIQKTLQKPFVLNERYQKKGEKQEDQDSQATEEDLSKIKNFIKRNSDHFDSER